MEREHLYFLGIAGHAMSGLAIAAKSKGMEVSGVGVGAYPPATDALTHAGIHFYGEYDAEHIQPGMTVVLANAIGPENVELRRAQKMSLRVLSFPALLEEWTKNQKRIVVAGTHGKTTTTTLIAWLLHSAGQPVDFMIGMPSINFGASVQHTGAATIVIEGDEYSASQIDDQSKFAFYHPDVLVITSFEWDHPDLFPEIGLMRTRYEDLIAGLSGDGLLVANADSHEVLALAEKAPCRVVTYSVTGQSSDYQAYDVEYDRTETHFKWRHDGQERAPLTTVLAGSHNVANIMGAIAALDGSVDFEAMAEGLLSFLGARRRFELVGEENGVVIIDDYAHHPSEVAATLMAAKRRYPGSRIWAFFLPHTYSRTRALLSEFATAFASADVVLIGEIEASREAGQEATVTASDVVAQLPRNAKQLHYEVDIPRARQLLVENVEEGDVVVCMSVSGANKLAERVLEGLRERVR